LKNYISSAIEGTLIARLNQNLFCSIDVPYPGAMLIIYFL